MDVEQALESARCAYVNLDNMRKMMPALKLHPLLPIVEAQIESVIVSLDGGEFIEAEKRTRRL